MDINDLGKTPIPGAVPAGWDVRSDKDFESLAAEIDKLSSPSFSSSIDWNTIIVIAERILGEKSKDILVMSYLCVALVKIEGLRGLAKGIHVLREAIETFWEDMFPVKKRMRGRKNAIDWLTDYLRDNLSSLSQERWAINDRNRFLEDLNSLDRFLSENMEDAPMLIPIINEVSARIVEEETAGLLEKAEPQLPGGSKQSATPQKAVLAEINLTDADPEKALTQALDVLGQAATRLGDPDQPNPLSFRLNRIAAWSSVTELPPTTGSKTYLPSPDSQIVNILENLYQSYNWKDLLQAAESRVRQFLFWLDLSRYVAESLEQLRCHEGAEMVVTETLLYIKRLPGVEKLTFEDGMAFANEQTRTWLRSQRERQFGSEVEKTLSEAHNINKAIEEALGAARKLVLEHKMTEALRQYDENMRRQSSIRDKFLWQHGLCRLLFDMQQPRLALPHIRDMLVTIDNYKIEQWEPKMAINALTTILTGLRLQPEKDQDQFSQVLDRLAKLDPVKALDFV